MKARSSVVTTIVSSVVVMAVASALWSFSGTARAQQPPQTSADAAPPTTVPLSSTGDGKQEGQPPAADWILEAGPDFPQGTTGPAAAFTYHNLLATAFRPRQSSTLYQYSGSGCINLTGGTDPRFQAPLLLPEGAVIKYLRIYYNDTTTENLTAWITRYQPGVSNADLTVVTSTGNTGYGTALSAEITHTVDLVGWTYTLIWGPAEVVPGLSLCGVRVTYYAPSIFGSFMPLVQRN
jgi:hypothetical protein